MRDLSLAGYRALAEFRCQIRRFLHFSEEQVRSLGLEPQQHQLLLTIKGLPPGTRATIGELASRLQLKHHSLVELVDRLEKRRYIERQRDDRDRRVVRLILTPAGEAVLRKLVTHSLTELRTEAPALLRSLTVVLRKK